MIDEFPRGQSPDFEAQEAALRAWGVSDALFPYASWAVSSNLIDPLPPQITLPDGWNPSAEPRHDEVVNFLRAGGGLCVCPTADFDVAWITDALPYLSSFHADNSG